MRRDNSKQKKHPNKELRIIQLEIQAGLTISSREERQDEASSCDKNSDRSLHRPQVQLGERRAGPGKTVALCASTAAGGHPLEHATSQWAKRGKDGALKTNIDVVMWAVAEASAFVPPLAREEEKERESQPR